jgi:hypothetical protein
VINPNCAHENSVLTTCDFGDIRSCAACEYWRLPHFPQWHPPDEPRADRRIEDYDLKTAQQRHPATIASASRMTSDGRHRSARQ